MSEMRQPNTPPAWTQRPRTCGGMRMELKGREPPRQLQLQQMVMTPRVRREVDREEVRFQTALPKKP